MKPINIDSEMMHAFFTGSRVYGKINEASDLDMVVLVKDGLDRLCCASDTEIETDRYESKPQSASLRFGRLNIIAVTDDTEFQAWKSGTEECRQLMSDRMDTKGLVDGFVTRDEAKAIMKAAYDKLGIVKDEGVFKSA